jgi:hypothetical protein
VSHAVVKVIEDGSFGLPAEDGDGQANDQSRDERITVFIPLAKAVE